MAIERVPGERVQAPAHENIRRLPSPPPIRHSDLPSPQIRRSAPPQPPPRRSAPHPQPPRHSDPRQLPLPIKPGPGVIPTTVPTQKYQQPDYSSGSSSIVGGGSEAPVTFKYTTEDGPSVAPAAEYTAVLEGVSSTFGSLEAASEYLTQNAKDGDRFEVLVNGQTTGLKIKTSAGPVSVPEDSVAQVRSMTHEQVLATIASATASAAPAASSGSGGGSGLLWTLILGGAAALAAK